MVNFLNKILKTIFKPKGKMGEAAIIRWTQPAIEQSMGYSFLKKITYMYDGYIEKEEQYSIPKMMELRRKRIPIIDSTKGEIIPKQSMFVPKTYHILGTIQLPKRIF